MDCMWSDKHRFFLEFNCRTLQVSGNSEITLRFPELITEIKDNAGKSMNVTPYKVENGSIVTFPKGMGRKYYLSVVN